MKEDFLHYVWQYQLFNKNSLQTTQSERIQIFKSGYLNTNSGPDFSEAIIQIGNQKWAGSVEIHLKSSDWYAHNHETDTAYDNVILHVVWEDDMPVYRKNNTQVSCLVLKGLVSKNILDNYTNLLHNNKKWIACENSIGSLEAFKIQHWLERLYVARLEEKSQEIQELLSQSANDWEGVLFLLLAENFGLKVNKKAFLQVAQSIPYTIIRKERQNLLHLEALLLGQAGLLDVAYEDAYSKELLQAYHYLFQKYHLQKPVLQMQFFRLRPPNFPTIRLSQLANLLHQQTHLFHKLMEQKELKEYYQSLTYPASSYWNTHYVFDKESKKSTKNLSTSFIDLLMINSIIPLKFSYGQHIGNVNVARLFKILRQIKSEKNGIIRRFDTLGVSSKNALDSQALIQLKNRYCNRQACLQCAVGSLIIKDA